MGRESSYLSVPAPAGIIDWQECTSRAPIRDRRLSILGLGEIVNLADVPSRFLVPRPFTPSGYVLAQAGCDHIRVNTRLRCGSNSEEPQFRALIQKTGQPAP